MKAIHQLLQQHSSEMERARNYSFSSIPGVPGVPARKQLHTDSCTVLGSNDHREAFFPLFNSLYISKKIHSASLSSSVSEQGGLQQE